MQSTALGDYQMSTLIHVRKVDGSNRYYRVIDEDTIEELTRDEFIAAEGIEG